MAENEEETKRLFEIASRNFEEHTKRISALLDQAQHKFEHDHTSFCALFGVVLVVFACVLAWFEKAESFSIVIAAAGFLLFSTGLILRHISADKQIRNTKALMEMERERSSFAQKSAILQHCWLYGQPKTLTLEQVRFFLGESGGSQGSPSLSQSGSPDKLLAAKSTVSHETKEHS